jgi:hypothetical protein
VREIILVQVETWAFVAESYAKAGNLSRLEQDIGVGYGKVGRGLHQVLCWQAASIDVEVRSVTPCSVAKPTQIGVKEVVQHRGISHLATLAPE